MDTRKTITVGRVKGSMVYSGTDFHPLEGDLYLHSTEYSFYQYVNGEWIETANLEEHSLETESISIATSDSIDMESDKEIPTSKAVASIINQILENLNFYDYTYTTNPYIQDGVLFLDNVEVEDGVLYLRNSKVENNTLYLWGGLNDNKNKC